MIQRFRDTHKENLLIMLALETKQGRKPVSVSSIRKMINTAREKDNSTTVYKELHRQNHLPTLKALAGDGYIKLLRHPSTLHFHAQLTDQGLKKAFEFYQEGEGS